MRALSRDRWQNLFVWRRASGAGSRLATGEGSVGEAGESDSRGHVDFAGNMDTSITIRTMLVRPGMQQPEYPSSAGALYVKAGGGIAADRDAAAECLETQNRARALLDALRRPASASLNDHQSPS